MYRPEKLTKKRLKQELTSPKFLKEISDMVDTSIKKELIGRFGFFYSAKRDTFHVDSVVHFYNEDDLEKDKLDYGREYTLLGEKHSELWPNLFRSKSPDQGKLIAQIYTLPENYSEPFVRAFNIIDLAIARKAMILDKDLENLFKRNHEIEQVFRPFGIVIDKPWQEKRELMCFHFYSELTKEPYHEKIGRNKVPTPHEIAESQDTTPIGLLRGILQASPKRTHAFNMASFEYINNQFIGQIESKVLDEIFKWD